MSREQILSGIRGFVGVLPERELMDAMQERGLVADEAVNLADVPDADLFAALVKLQKQKG
jgi:hypothetical protein